MIDIRQFMDAYERCTSYGWLDWEEALLLVDYARRTRGPMVEVGSYYGRSAMLLGQLTDNGTFADPKSGEQRRMLYCVDPWCDEKRFSTDQTGSDIFARFMANIRGIHLNRIVPCRTRVEAWVPEQASFVYLDGDHSY